MAFTFDVSAIFPESSFAIENGLVNYLAQVHRRIGPSPKNFHNSNLLTADPFCVYRGSPFLDIHDGFGYKNPSIPENCDLLILGNSMVHDMYSRYEDTWPYYLSRRLNNISVYSAAVGGSSIVQYLMYLSEVVALKPKCVLLCYYFGNNVFNSSSSLNSLRESDYKDLYRFKLSEVPKLLPVPEVEKKIEFLKSQSTLSRKDALLSGCAHGIKDCTFLNVSNFDICLTPFDTKRRVDMKNAFNLHAFEFSLTAFSIFLTMAQYFNFEPMVLGIPSRERIVAPYVSSQDKISKDDLNCFEEIVQSEAYFENIIIEHLESLGIRYKSIVGEISLSLRKGFYKANTDDFHPAPFGKYLIANSVASMVSNNLKVY